MNFNPRGPLSIFHR